MDAHVGHLDEVLTLLGTTGFSLKLAKCFFFKDTVDHLGRFIRPGKLAVTVKNTDSLRSALPPTTQTELRSFLGLCNVYRRFVPGFYKVSGPLNHLLKKGEGPKLGTLTKEQLLAFETLREKLLQPPILALPRREGRYILDTDASDGQIGCCLSQDVAAARHKCHLTFSRGLHLCICLCKPRNISSLHIPPPCFPIPSP
jgi:RNase H-like domain found in reverse transcriptase